MPYKTLEARRAYDLARDQLPHRRNRKRYRSVNHARQAWFENHPDYMVKWRAAHPGYRSPSLTIEQDRAHQAVTRAVRKGRLLRGPCEMCETTNAVQGHHAFGYEQAHQLDVWWLCRRHHLAMHRFIRA